MASNATIGTRKSGYAGPEYGPFKCGNCVHFSSPNKCAHPDVVSDPAVKGTVSAGGCCTYFRNDRKSTFYGS